MTAGEEEDTQRRHGTEHSKSEHHIEEAEDTAMDHPLWCQIVAQCAYWLAREELRLRLMAGFHYYTNAECKRMQRLMY